MQVGLPLCKWYDRAERSFPPIFSKFLLTGISYGPAITEHAVRTLVKAPVTFAIYAQITSDLKICVKNIVD